MTDEQAELELFDALLGTWATEVTHPAVDVVVTGTVTFELLEGGHFLLVRTRNEQEMFPDSLGVIGVPETGEGLVMDYFDSRGVRRTYGVSFDDGVLRHWRNASGFDQRFSATLGRDSFQGMWQVARTAGDWQDDLWVIYRRTDASEAGQTTSMSPS